MRVDVRRWGRKMIRKKEMGGKETGLKETGAGRWEGKVTCRLVRGRWTTCCLGTECDGRDPRRARVFEGDSIVRKIDRVLNKGDDMVVCFPGAKKEAITERVEKIADELSAAVESGMGSIKIFLVASNV